MAPKNRWFAASPNTDYIYKALTDGTVTNLTGGRIPKMNAAQAAGLVGSWLIETGRKDLSNLDVVEAGSGRGRGLSQYTGVRRTPYDQAVQQARAAGEDPNSAQWQIKYFAQEYMNRDLIGWTQVFERMPKNLKSPGEYARYFTGSAKEGKGYFRPGVPHTDRRIQAAMEVFNHYTKKAAPKPQAPATTPQPKSGGNPLDTILQKLGINKGNQSFNTDKLQRTLGSIAANTPSQDIGFAIFASQKGNVNKAAKAWRSLNNNTRKAYGRAGAQLAIRTPGMFGGSNSQPYKMPTKLTIGSGSQNYRPNPVTIGSNSGYTGKSSISSSTWKPQGRAATASWENSSYSWDRDRRNDLNSSWRDAGKNLSVSGGRWGYSASNVPGFSVGTVSPVGAPSYSGVSYAGGNPLSR